MENWVNIFPTHKLQKYLWVFPRWSQKNFTHQQLMHSTLTLTTPKRF